MVNVILMEKFFFNNPKLLFALIFKYSSWKQVQRFKKHVAIDHCRNFDVYHNSFIKKWNGFSGIYKITFLPLKLFTYYGSSSNLGQRFKYHYYNGPKLKGFLGMFLSVFSWSNFSVSVVELADKDKLQFRESWYLKTFSPLLNVLTESYIQSPTTSNAISDLTKAKISKTLTGRIMSESANLKHAKTISGAGNHYFGRSLPSETLDRAAELKGIKVFVYDKDFNLVAGAPFRSIKRTASYLGMHEDTVKRNLDKKKLHKSGYYFFTKSI